jgi:hypothetical protein
MVTTTPEEHRALAAEYIRLAETSLTEAEQRTFARMAQEHLLMIKRVAYLVSSR